MSARRRIALAAATAALAIGATAAEEAPAPALDLLEYLGSWEESDEDWVLFSDEPDPVDESTDDAGVDGPERDGETLAELDDEE